MNIMDFELRVLYQKILIGLLSIKRFSKNYYRRNKKIHMVVVDFLRVISTNRFPFNKRSDKRVLLRMLRKEDLSNLSDSKLLQKVMYDNDEDIQCIFYKCYSLFSDLMDVDKKLLIVIDLCENSLLHDIFHSEEIPFRLKDFYSICEFALDVKKKEIKESVERLVQKELVFLNGPKEPVCLTKNFSLELIRLSTLPEFNRQELNCYEIQGDDAEKSISKGGNMAFSGYWADSYVFSKLESEEISYWYAEDLNSCEEILDFFQKNRLSDQCIWLGDYEGNEEIEEKHISYMLARMEAKLIVSGFKLEIPFGVKSNKVSLKEEYLEKMMNDKYPIELTSALNASLSNLPDYVEKEIFLRKLDKSVKEKGDDHAFECLTELFESFAANNGSRKEVKGKTKKGSEPLCPILEEDFRKYYGYDETCYADNPTSAKKIQEIYKKLIAPSDYLRADKKTLDRIISLINLHPNILDKEKILSYLKTTLLFSKSKIIKIKPLILVGSPGCGKTMFCKQLREIIRQDNDIFIPLGSGSGVDMLMGITPGYKNATNGKILSSIWLSMNNTNCLNPVIVLDELDKAKFSTSGDINQDVYPALIQLLGDENLSQFKDNFFEVPVQNFFPIFLATANTIDTIPKPLMDRVEVIHFRNYTAEEMKNIIIPFQYESFRKGHNKLVPKKLEEEEIEILYKMCNGRTRQVVPSIYKYLSAMFDTQGRKHQLSSEEIKKLVRNISDDEKQMGFSI